jgi:very-short-patch-repair endonuclease
LRADRSVGDVSGADARQASTAQCESVTTSLAPSAGPSFAGRRTLRATLREGTRPWSLRACHASRRQVPVGHRFIVDFLAPSIKLVVEVDGSAHRHKRQADARREQKLRRLGYVVLRLDAASVVFDLPSAVARVTGVVEAVLATRRAAGRRCLSGRSSRLSRDLSVLVVFVRHARRPSTSALLLLSRGPATTTKKASVYDSRLVPAQVPRSRAGL